MRISDWSSDVCSSDLREDCLVADERLERRHARQDNGLRPSTRGEVAAAFRELRERQEGPQGHVFAERNQADLVVGGKQLPGIGDRQEAVARLPLCAGALREAHGAGEQDAALRYGSRDCGAAIRIIRQGQRKRRLGPRSEENTSELQPLMRISYDV